MNPVYRWREWLRMYSAAAASLCADFVLMGSEINATYCAARYERYEWQADALMRDPPEPVELAS